MPANLGKLRALLAEGWEVVDISSDAWDIEVLLRRGPYDVVLRLDRVDAAELLRGQTLVEAA